MFVFVIFVFANAFVVSSVVVVVVSANAVVVKGQVSYRLTLARVSLAFSRVFARGSGVAAIDSTECASSG